MKPRGQELPGAMADCRPFSPGDAMGHGGWDFNDLETCAQRVYRKANLSAEGKNDFAGKGGASANNTFIGTITVTVDQSSGKAEARKSPVRKLEKKNPQ